MNLFRRLEQLNGIGAAIQRTASGACNLEYDVALGRRGSRYTHCVALLCELTGAEDAIVDVVAVVFGTELLGIERYHASEIVVGTGIVQCAHGALPIPAPATLELLAGIPIRSGELRGELELRGLARITPKEARP